jgi:hypothetical protein
MIQNLFTLKDAVNDALKVMVSSNLLFTPNEWSILTGVAKILKPFDEVTRDLSSQNYSSISKVIASIRILQRLLGEMRFDNNCSILTLFELKTRLLRNITQRFNESMETSRAHLISTFLDPR